MACCFGWPRAVGRSLRQMRATAAVTDRICDRRSTPGAAMAQRFQRAGWVGTRKQSGGCWASRHAMELMLEHTLAHRHRLRLVGGESHGRSQLVQQLVAVSVQRRGQPRVQCSGVEKHCRHAPRGGVASKSSEHLRPRRASAVAMQPTIQSSCRRRRTEASPSCTAQAAAPT